MPDVVNQVVSAALGGDITACKILFDKVLPSVRPTSPRLSIPLLGESPVSKSSAVIEAMLKGSIAPDQAAIAISVMVDHARLYEQTELEARLVALERGSNVTAV